MHKLDSRNSQRTVLSTATATLMSLVKYKSNIPVLAWPTDIKNFIIILSYRNQVAFNHRLHNRPTVNGKAIIHTLTFDIVDHIQSPSSIFKNTIKAFLKASKTWQLKAFIKNEFVISFTKFFAPSLRICFRVHCN